MSEKIYARSCTLFNIPLLKEDANYRESIRKQVIDLVSDDIMRTLGEELEDPSCRDGIELKIYWRFDAPETQEERLSHIKSKNMAVLRGDK